MKLGKMMYYDQGMVPFEDGVHRKRYGRTLVNKTFQDPAVGANREIEIPMFVYIKMGL